MFFLDYFLKYSLSAFESLFNHLLETRIFILAVRLHIYFPYGNRPRTLPNTLLEQSTILGSVQEFRNKLNHQKENLLNIFIQTSPYKILLGKETQDHEPTQDHIHQDTQDKQSHMRRRTQGILGFPTKFDYIRTEQQCDNHYTIIRKNKVQRYKKNQVSIYPHTISLSLSPLTLQ